MLFLTVDLIKKHAHIDFDDQDKLIELYGNSIEQTIAKTLNRGLTASELVQSLVEEYGEVPADIIHAGLMLAAESYDVRNPASPVQRHTVPYGVEMKLKPYMRLTTNKTYNNGTGCKNL